VINLKGAPANGLGNARPNGPVAECCRAAPSVLEFDAKGKLLNAWGGPADPGFMQNRCREDQGCIWPNLEHGIYVDKHDNVWLAGSSGKVPTDGAAWTTNSHGGDGFVLKFDMNGNFKMRIGGTPTAPNSNDTGGGINGTPSMYMPADMVVDEATNRLYVADGYGNRRVLIVDATTGKYIGHFGAYGNNPVDDAGAAAAGRWPADYAKGATKPAFFRNPVHCVKIADDGKIYVCDRGNDRIQVFNKADPSLGEPCADLRDGQVRLCRRAVHQRAHRDLAGHARHLGVDELLQGQGPDVPLRRRQHKPDHLYPRPQDAAGAGPPGQRRAQHRPIPLAAPGEPGQPRRHLHRRSGHRKTHPEVRPLRRSRLQRLWLSCGGRSGGAVIGADDNVAEPTQLLTVNRRMSP